MKYKVKNALLFTLQRGKLNFEKKQKGVCENERSIHILSDGSCDLPLELTKEKNITVVPFYVSFEEGKYQKEMVEIGVREFYQKMVDHPDVYPKSSMPSVQDYLDAFLPYVKAGTPIICICITTKFSGSMQSALNAKAILEEEYPESQIYVCDSCVNTVLQGIYVLEAVRLRDAGAGYQESIDRLNEIKSSGRIFFTVGNMEYLKHGGRIGKVASVAGSLLGIKPIITLKEGEIFPSGIGRSRRKTVDKHARPAAGISGRGEDRYCRLQYLYRIRLR